jgi:Ran GTPase-activating protein (RanGAP) involved in mRNA processing and transport
MIRLLTYLIQTLTTLNLAGNQIRKLGAEYLSNALQINKVRMRICFRVIYFLIQTLTNLDLSQNAIRSAGARVVSQAIRNNKVLDNSFVFDNFYLNNSSLMQTLTVLNLQHNHIGEIGIKCLTAAVQKNQVRNLVFFKIEYKTYFFC